MDSDAPEFPALNEHIRREERRKREERIWAQERGEQDQVDRQSVEDAMPGLLEHAPQRPGPQQHHQKQTEESDPQG